MLILKKLIKKLPGVILTDKVSIAVEIACIATATAFDIWNSDLKDKTSEE